MSNFVLRDVPFTPIPKRDRDPTKTENSEIQLLCSRDFGKMASLRLVNLLDIG